MTLTAEKALCAFRALTFPETFTYNLTVALGTKTVTTWTSQLGHRVRFCAVRTAVKTHACSNQHLQICPNQSDEVKDFQLKHE